MHNKHSPNKPTVYSVYCVPCLRFYNHTHEHRAPIALARFWHVCLEQNGRDAVMSF